MRRLTEQSARFLPLLAWGLSLLLLVAVCAELLIRYLTPEPLVALPDSLTDPRIAAQRLADAEPMRSVAGSAVPVAQAGGGFAGLQLVGVATGFAGGTAFALIQQRGDAARPFLVGDRLPSGLEVLAIHADRVELGNGGTSEALMLSRHPAGTPVTSISHSAGYAPAVSASPR